MLWARLCVVHPQSHILHFLPLSLSEISLAYVLICRNGLFRSFANKNPMRQGMILTSPIYSAYSDFAAIRTGSPSSRGRHPRSRPSLHGYGAAAPRCHPRRRSSAPSFFLFVSCSLSSLLGRVDRLGFPGVEINSRTNIGAFGGCRNRQ